MGTAVTGIIDELVRVQISITKQIAELPKRYPDSWQRSAVRSQLEYFHGQIETRIRNLEEREEL